jgi:hypothetical protein
MNNDDRENMLVLYFEKAQVLRLLTLSIENSQAKVERSGIIACFEVDLESWMRIVGVLPIKNFQTTICHVLHSIPFKA